MHIFGDYHTHTTYSHGKGSILENVVEARKIGLKEIGITDHGPEHFTFGVKRDDFKRMREEIDRINENSDGVKVLFGVECNIVSGSGIIDIDDKMLEMMDYIVAGYHMMSKLRTPKDYLNFYGRHYSGQVIKPLRLRNRDINTRAMIATIENYPLAFVSHPAARMDVDILEVAKTAVAHGTFIEINEKGNEMTAEDLVGVKALGAKFIVNSDAHTVSAIGRVEKSIILAEEAGLTAEDIVNMDKLPVFRRK